ncbi:PLP-dependent aminotransferase family protein [Taibaiella sp. KBW10]|uniref:aminotransferase-like domain-containing protein n=1 Tax=Taibaiella sp. KBW10 TaxID=2153357 RepID=UPI000F59C590|nr:PLP-dependent aminotransferase family protein [Taibaiella sp. KBW10]RQO32203.1 PLP-dependent aminotransferase family protein [Taibaiella sp. KBW10]
MPREVIYQKIARIIEQQIATETLQVGDKLPSIRTVQQIYQVSLNTVKQAFLELEKKSLICSRPKSGYYVAKSFKRHLAIPSVSMPKAAQNERPSEDLVGKLFNILNDRSIAQFSLGLPDQELLPIAKLNKGIIKALSTLPDSGTGYEPAQGSLNLRRNVSKWSFVWGGQLQEEDIVTTSGATNAIFHCMMAVTQPGDSIAVESPLYFGVLQVAKSLGLNVIELPTHPQTGIEIDALKKVLPKIKACFLISNFNNPLGSCMPDEHKKEVVRMLTAHNIPLIEDDLYGDIFFGEQRPVPCKAYDEAGMVLWCGSVSKTLAPGYRVGWVAPGKFKEKIIRQKLLHTLAMPPLYQEVVADFMEHGRYDHHMRTLRYALHSNSLLFQRAITAYFPECTKVTQPNGGFVLWLELDKRIDTAHLFDLAIKQGVSFVPGRMFTLHDQFHNCMRISFGMKWNNHLDFQLKKLGNMIKDAL